MKNYKDQGLGMANNTAEHNMCFSYIRDGIISLFPERFRPNVQIEVPVDNPDGFDHVEPDVSVWRYSRYRNDVLYLKGLLLVIEVIHSQQNYVYSKSAVLKCFKYEPTMREGFLFDYEAKVWIRLTRQPDGAIIDEDSDYSRVLKRHLNPMTRVRNDALNDLPLPR